MARAIWKGRLRVGERDVAVKMYSAVEDRKVHFRLLHAKDHAPVEQRIVRKADGKDVPPAQQRKAFPVEPDVAVILQPDELDALEPEPSRDIVLCRFVPPALLGDQWYDRPYYLGPDDDASAYFALVQAIERARRIGIARWVMRGKRYVGAVGPADGYLAMVTLRRADQVLSVSGIDLSKAQTPDPAELRLAEQLVSAISADFEPQSWHDEYRERVCRLIEAKARGETVKAKPRARPRGGANLADSLRKSLAAMKERELA